MGDPNASIPMPFGAFGGAMAASAVFSLEASMNRLPPRITTALLNRPAGAICLNRQATNNLGYAVAVKPGIVTNSGGQKLGVKHPRFGFKHLNAVPPANGLGIRRGQNSGPQRRFKQFQTGNIGAQIGQFVGGAKTVHGGSFGVAHGVDLHADD